MSDLPDNVVSIETRFAEAPPVERLERRYDECLHKHTYLDDRLRTVGCRDCGEERLDPFEVLLALAGQWRSWQWEADRLAQLNAEYRRNARDKWERARDRHLEAHEDHRARHFGALPDGSVVPREALVAQDYNARRAPGAYGYGVTLPQDCRTCYRLVRDFDHRGLPSRAPEPTPGRLEPG